MKFTDIEMNLLFWFKYIINDIPDSNTQKKGIRKNTVETIL